MSNINEQLQSIVDKNDVVLFMKGTPDAPQCGFSSQAVQILRYIDVNFKAVNCLETDELRQESRASRIGRRFRRFISRVSSSAARISCARRFRTGELFTALTEKGIACKAPAGAQA